MYKKIIVILTTLLLLIGCSLFKKDSGSDIDNSIELVLKSKPVSQNAERTVYFRYSATKGNLKESDFLYSYTLQESEETSSAVIYKYPETGIYGPNCEAEFKKLINGKSYIFKVKAYNSIDNSISKEISYEFKVKYDYKFSYGILSDSSDIYGESDGILKKGQKFKVYATLINSNATAVDSLLKSTNVTLKLDLSNFIGAEISSESKVEQSFEVNSTTGAVWIITAPSESVKGDIKINVEETPYYNVSNIPVIDDSSEIKIDVETRNPGKLTLLNFSTGASSVSIGKSCTITVSLKNEGDTLITLSSAEIIVYDGLNNDISSNWSTTESIIGEVIGANSTVTKNIVYNVSENSDFGDVYIVFKAKGYEAVSKESIEIESEKKTIFITSQ